MNQHSSSDPHPDQRRTRREFIRTHHPDVGGNHDHFITGLASLDAGHRPSVPVRTVTVTVVARQPWPLSLTTAVLRRLRRRHQKPRVR